VDNDRLHAVLIEPQVEHFRQLCGVGEAPLTVSFEGYHRHAILSEDRVFLFARDQSRVAGLHREAAVLAALAGRGVPAPLLCGQWQDTFVSPYPFLAVSRLPGRTWSSLEARATLPMLTTVLARLGQTIASWHQLDLPTLPRAIRRPLGHITDFGRLLDGPFLHAAARVAAQQLGLSPGQATTWLRALDPVLTLAPVFVHGDINEGQILVDDALAVQGILDWEAAGVGHPLKDFDFGEWGYGIFAWEPHFAVLRQALWETYAKTRGGGLPAWRAIHLFFCLVTVGTCGDDATHTDWKQARLHNTLALLRELEL